MQSPDAGLSNSEAVLTMPRVRVSSHQVDIQPADLAAHQEPELWERMQRAAGLARAGKPFEAAAEFGSITDSVLALDEPRLTVIGAKAGFNRAVVFEKLVKDADRAEDAFEHLYQTHSSATTQDILLVAARAGLHSARLIAGAGRAGEAIQRYQDRLGRFRDVLPPAELRTFYLDYQRLREEARKRGIDVPTASPVTTTQPRLGATSATAATPVVDTVNVERLQGMLEEFRSNLRADLHADLNAEIGRLKVSLTDLNSDLVSLHGQQRALLTQQSDRDAMLREDHRNGALAIRNEVRRLIEDGTRQSRIGYGLIVGATVLLALLIVFVR